MSHLTSEEATLAVGNKYDLVLIASRRVRELRNGHAPMVTTPHPNDIVTALTEIEQGHVGREYLLKTPNIERDIRRKLK